MQICVRDKRLSEKSTIGVAWRLKPMGSERAVWARPSCFAIAHQGAAEAACWSSPTHRSEAATRESQSPCLPRRQGGHQG